MRKPNFATLIFNKEAVVQAAASLGLTQKRGRGTGEKGSIGLMLNNIGAGEVLLLMHIYDDGNEMRRAAKQIRNIAETADRHIENTLNGLAAALESAAILKDESE